MLTTYSKVSHINLLEEIEYSIQTCLSKYILEDLMRVASTNQFDKFNFFA